MRRPNCKLYFVLSTKLSVKAKFCNALKVINSPVTAAVLVILSLPPIQIQVACKGLALFYPPGRLRGNGLLETCSTITERGFAAGTLGQLLPGARKEALQSLSIPLNRDAADINSRLRPHKPAFTALQIVWIPAGK